MNNTNKKDAPMPTETSQKINYSQADFTKKKSNSQYKGDGSGRSRTWATIVYEDSAPKNWKELLEEMAIPLFISPYHDKDINADKTPKKPHWHVLFMFDGVKNKEQIKSITDIICSVGQENVGSTRGYARYLCHLDNADKVQYETKDVMAFGGADYQDVIGLPSDKYIMLDEMMDFCDKYNVMSLYALMNYSRNHREDWKRVLVDSGAYIMKEWLTSRKWSIDNGVGAIVDSETGEVIE